ncbi:valine--tRNA ligase [Granulicella cerasi]|uniref:Valine--tRNA ligase n=1 Tax=Granulicella cerasi TaxID=741063 RepID=A0ABW1ZC06_9BACT|nr:valine--tRNA ligase [Granulicella cerasi]
MNHELPKAYDPSTIETKWANFWVDEKIFDVPTPSTADNATKSFVQLLPPPNVTGRLHMGHMLNQTEMDILARWHRMKGERSVWVPGTDHAGIATQMMVERALKAEGKQRTDFTRDEFVERVWSWKQEYGGYITGQMRRLGASVDWSREYFTMDDKLSHAVREVFVKLHEQGLIYRGAYIVNWDPVLGTAVSDVEVENEEKLGSIYHLRYELADGSGSITIATTRPETMLGDVAVAVNAEDDRYKAFIGKKLVLPLVGREIPVIADDWANPEFGTGAVKVTPAHDPNDFAIGQRHNLPQPLIMDAQARIANTGTKYDGLDRFEARKQILADLEALGQLVAIKDHTLTLPVSQRTGSVIEPRLSMQWFLAVNKKPTTGGDSIAETAISAVRDGHISFVPEMHSKVYFEWMNNLHDWCISRQLWWGHRIPAWHCTKCGETTVARETPTACSKCGATEITQETDVLDTWFSSGLLPFTVFGWDGSNKLTDDLKAFYPTNLLVTGFDILFFWVARMIMLGSHFMLDVPNADGSQRTLADAVPFKDVYIHPLVRDANREKMSKTKGNVIDPISIVEKYGTDAVRFTLASQASPGTDIAFNEARTEGYRAFANKIWNAARFLQMNIDRGAEAGYKVALIDDLNAAPLETRWLYSRLSAVAAEVERSLTDYRFDEASQAVYAFFWNEFCDWYLELVKLRLDFNAPQNATTALTLNALVTAFEAALRLLSPFMPFITEELFHALYASIGLEVPAKSIALTRYPQAKDFPFDAEANDAMTTLQELIVTVRGLRKELGVPEKEAAPIEVFSNGNAAKLAVENADMLAKQARVSEVGIATVAPSGTNARATASFDVAVIYERQIDVAAERERLTKEIAKLNKGLEAAGKQLGSESFLAKAPAHIVDGLKKQAAENQALLDKAEAQLAQL